MLFHGRPDFILDDHFEAVQLTDDQMESLEDYRARTNSVTAVISIAANKLGVARSPPARQGRVVYNRPADDFPNRRATPACAA